MDLERLDFTEEPLLEKEEVDEEEQRFPSRRSKNIFRDHFHSNNDDDDDDDEGAENDGIKRRLCSLPARYRWTAAGFWLAVTVGVLGTLFVILSVVSLLAMKHYNPVAAGTLKTANISINSDNTATGTSGLILDTISHWHTVDIQSVRCSISFSPHRSSQITKQQAIAEQLFVGYLTVTDVGKLATGGLFTRGAAAFHRQPSFAFTDVQTANLELARQSVLKGEDLVYANCVIDLTVDAWGFISFSMPYYYHHFIGKHLYHITKPVVDGTSITAQPPQAPSHHGHHHSSPHIDFTDLSKSALEIEVPLKVKVPLPSSVTSFVIDLPPTWFEAVSKPCGSSKHANQNRPDLVIASNPISFDLVQHQQGKLDLLPTIHLACSRNALLQAQQQQQNQNDDSSSDDNNNNNNNNNNHGGEAESCSLLGFLREIGGQVVQSECTHIDITTPTPNLLTWVVNPQHNVTLEKSVVVNQSTSIEFHLDIVLDQRYAVASDFLIYPDDQYAAGDLSYLDMHSADNQTSFGAANVTWSLEHGFSSQVGYNISIMDFGVLGTANIDVNTDAQTLAIAIAQIHNNEPLLTANLAGSWTAGDEDNGPITASMQGDAVWSGSTPFNVDFTGGLNIDTNTSTYDLTLSGLYNSSNTFATVGGSIFASFAEYWQPFSMIVGAAAHFNDTQLFLLNITAAQSPNYDGFSTNSTFYLYLSDSLNIGAQVKFASQEDAYSLLVEADKNASPIFSLTSAGQLINDYDMFSLYGEANAFLTNLDQTALLWNVSSTLDIQVGNDNLLAQLIALNNATNLLTVSLAGGFNFDDGFALNSSLFIEWGDNDFVLDSPLIVELSGTSKEYLVSYQLTENGNLLLDLASSGSYADAEDFFSAQTDLLLYSAPTLFDFNIYGNASVSLAYGSNNTADFNLNALLSSSDETLFSLSVEGKYTNSEIDSTNTIQASVLAQVGSDNTLTSNLSIINNYDNSSTTLSFTGYLNDDGFNLQSNSYQTVVYNENDSETTSTYSTNSLAWTATNPFTATFDYVNQEIRSFETGASDHFITLGSSLIYNDTTTQLFELLWQGASSPISGNASLSWDFFSATGNVVANYNFADDFSLYFDAQTGQETLLTLAVDGQFDDAEESWNCDGSLSWLPENPNEFIFTFSTAGSFSNDTLSALLQAEYILNSSEVTNALIAQLQMDSSELTFSLEAGQHLTANVRVITAPITGDNNTGGITFDSVVSLVWNATDSPFTFLGNCSGFLAFTDESSEINAAAQVQLITRDISPIYSGTLVFTVTNDTITVQSAFARDQEPPVLVIDYILIFGLPDADHDIFSSVSTTAQLNWNGNGAFELTIHASGEYDSQDDHGFTVNGAAGFAFQPVSNSSSSSGLSIDGDFGLEYNRQSSSVTFQMEGDMNDEQKFALNVLATRSNTTGDDFEASVAATLKVGSNIAVAATLDASLYNQTAALRLTASNQNGDGLTLQLSGSLQRAEVQGDNTVFNGATSLSWVGDSPFTFNGTVLLTFSHEPSSATSFLLDVTGLLSADSTHNVNLHTEGRFTQLESLYQLSANASLALTDNIFQGFLTANYDTSSTSGSLGLTGAWNDEGLFNLQAVASFLSDDPIIALQTAASVSFSSSSTSFEYSGELGFTYDREQHILNLTATSPNLLEFNGLFQYELEDGFSASLRTYLFWNSTDSFTFLVSALVDYDSAAQSLNLQLTAASATETYCRLIVGGSYTSEPLIGVQGNMNFSASNFLIEGTFDFELDIDAKNVSLTLTSITNFDSEVTTVGADFSGSWTSLSDSGFLLTLQGELDITSDSSTKGTFSGRLSFDPDQQSVSASALLSFADAESSQQLTTTLQVGWVLSNGTSPFTTTAEITAQLEGTEDSHFADLKATAIIGNNNFDISATLTLNDPNPSYEAALQGNWLLQDDSFSLSFKANANQAAGFVLSTTGSFSVDWNEKQLSAGLTALFSAPDYEPFSLDANVTGFWYGTFKGGFEADLDGTVRVRDDIWLPFFEVSYSSRRAVEFNFGVNDPQETAFDLSLLLEFDDLDLSGDFSLVWPGLELEIITDFTIEASTTTGSYWHTGNADLQGFTQWTIGETAGGVYLNGNAGYTTVDFDDGSVSGDWAVSANYGIARQFGESVAGETTVASSYSFGNGLFLSLDSDSYLTVDESALYALSLSSALGQPEGISVLFEMTIDQPIVFALNGNYEYDSHPFTIGYSAEMQLLENGQSTLVATSNTKAELHHDKLKANSLTQCVGSSGQVLFNLDAALNGDLAQNLVEAIALLTIAEETLFEADSLTFWTTENGFAVQTYTTASIPNDVVTLSGVLDFNEIDTTVFGNLALALNSRDLLSGRVLAFWDFLDWPQTTAQLSGLASFTWSGFNEYNYDLLSVSAGGEVTVAQWSATTSLALRSSTYWDNWEAYVTGLASLDDLSPQGTFQVEVFSNEELLWHGLETFSLDLNPEAGTLALLSTAQVNGMNLLVVSGQSSWTLNSVSGFQAQLLGSLEYTPPSDNGDYDGDGSLTVDVAGSVSLLSPFSLHGTVKVNSHQYLEVDATATWQFECFDEEVCFSASGTAGFNWTPQDSYDDVIFSASGLVNFGNQQLTVSITQKQNQKTYLQGGLGASWDRLSGLSGRGNAWLAWADLWNVRGTANIDVNTLSNTMLAQATGSYNNFQYITIGSSGSWSTGNGISAQGTAYLNWNGPEAPFSLAGSANFDLTQPRNSLQVSATGKYNGQQYLSIGASLSGGNDFSFPLQGSGNLAWQGSHPFSVGTAFYLDVESDQSFDFRTSGSWNGIQYVVVETSGNWLFNDQTKVGGSASLQWNGSEDSNPFQVGGSFNFQLDPSADTFALSLSGQFDNNDEFSLNTQGSWGTTNGFSTQASGTFSWNGNDPFVVGGTTSFAFSSPSNTASLSATGQWNQVQYVVLNTRGNYSGETGFFVSATGSFDWTGETPFTTSSMLSANVDTTQDSYDVSTSLSYNTRSIYIGTSGSWQDV